MKKIFLFAIVSLLYAAGMRADNLPESCVSEIVAAASLMDKGYIDESLAILDSLDQYRKGRWR